VVIYTVYWQEKQSDKTSFTSSPPIIGIVRQFLRAYTSSGAIRRDARVEGRTEYMEFQAIMLAKQGDKTLWLLAISYNDTTRSHRSIYIVINHSSNHSICQVVILCFGRGPYLPMQYADSGDKEKFIINDN
jgi:hypothetical protein